MNTELNKQRETGSKSQLQEVYLNHCRKNRIKVDLKTSEKQAHITGYIIGFDSDAIIVESDGSQNLVYKSGIVSICPKIEVDFIFNDAWKKNRLNRMYYYG